MTSPQDAEPLGGQTEPPQNISADQMREDNQPKRVKSRFGHWRVYFFVLVLIVCTLLGVRFKREAEPPADNLTGPPLHISLYTTDPKAQANLAVSIVPSFNDSMSGKHVSASAGVYLSITPSQPGLNVSWIVLIGPDMPLGPNREFSDLRIPVKVGGANNPTASYFFAYGNLNDLKRMREREFGLAVTSFPGLASVTGLHIPDSVVTETNGNLSASLPRVGPESDDLSLPVPLVVETSPLTNVPVFATVAPEEVNLAPDPASAHYSTNVPDALVARFYDPQAIHTSEQILGVGRYLRNGQITSMVPPDGQVRGNDLAWRSDGALEPTVKITSTDEAQRRSSFDFYSGIAWATAAAALIAAVQELPSTLPPELKWLRRRARDGDREAADQSRDSDTVATGPDGE